MRDEPLFGDDPVHTTRSVVERVCVTGYTGSDTRPAIWEGFDIAHRRIQAARAHGEIWISGEFVVDCDHPNYAQVHLHMPDASSLTGELMEVLDWLTNSAEAEELSCDTTALVMVPEDHPSHPLVCEHREFYLSEFTAHERGRKGFPILDEPPHDE